MFSFSEEPFITLFQPGNCKIKVFFINNGIEEELLSNNANYIQHIISSSKENYYRYLVHAVSLINENLSMCSVIMSAISLDKNATLILGEESSLKFQFIEQPVN